MKYINKQSDESKQAAQDLHNWRDNYRDNDGKSFNDICDTLTSEKAWALISDSKRKKLRIALRREQGNICCYCGQKLRSDTVLEHFLNKAGNLCERTYNYKNLLASCNGNQSAGGAKKKYRTQGEITWEDVVQEINNVYGLVLTTQELQYMNIKEAEKSILEAKTSLKIEPSPQHCDVTKKEYDIPINPTELPDCWDRFDYTDDGDINGKDADAQKTIQILNLKAAILTKNRADAWIGFKEALEGKDGNQGELLMIQEEKSLNEKEALEFLLRLEVENDRTGHFCVVKRSFLKARISELYVKKP
jgi:hypothetical protein